MAPAGNLHPFVTEEVLQEVFAGLGGITELKVSPTTKGPKLMAVLFVAVSTLVALPAVEAGWCVGGDVEGLGVRAVVRLSSLIGGSVSMCADSEPAVFLVWWVVLWDVAIPSWLLARGWGGKGLRVRARMN